MGMIKFSWTNIFLLVGFVTAPIAALMLHLRIHPDYEFLTWILWFDIIIITSFYLFDKTRFTGFILNTVFFLVGVLMHFIVKGGIGDVLLAIPGFSIGWTLWILNKETYTKQLNKKVDSKIK